MKINKILCDVCGNEIDLEKDRGMAMYQSMFANTQIMSMPKKSQNPKDNLVQDTYEFCENCHSKLEEVIKEMAKNNNMTDLEEKVEVQIKD